MDYSIAPLSAIDTIKTDCLIVFVGKKAKALNNNDTLTALNSASGNLITALYKDNDFSANCGAAFKVAKPQGLKAGRLIMMGLGDVKKFGAAEQLKIIHRLAGICKSIDHKSATIVLEDLLLPDQTGEALVKLISQNIESASYHYDTTKSEKRKSKKLSAIKFQIGSSKNKTKLSQALNIGVAIGRGINTTKELGNLPGNYCTPTILAKKAQALSKLSPALKVKVLSEADMKKLKMGSLLSVSAGSDEPAKLICIEYQGAAKSKQPHVLVGKGVTFDTGGISLKPGAKMDEMKYDMCGAASVVGTLQAIAEIGAKVNVVGLIGATENMPNGNATKPGDVVTSMSGQTIEVLNTDAEGRLVLCDVLTYAAKYKPKTVIDIATLTGACVVALGSHATGLYSNDEKFGAELQQAGIEANDRAWPMPLWPEYDQQINSKYADMQNIGGPEGGSVTAACFLARFTKDYTWAHLDIAGTAWSNRAASGRPVAMLSQYLLNQA